MRRPEGLVAAFEAAKESDGALGGERYVGHAYLLLGALAGTAQGEGEQTLVDQRVAPFLSSRVEDDVTTGASGSRHAGLLGFQLDDGSRNRFAFAEQLRDRSQRAARLPNSSRKRSQMGLVEFRSTPDYSKNAEATAGQAGRQAGREVQ